ncbi:MAG: hypothetical protein U9N44_03985 [Chloroflexota bacterium]|nr:hypothetical protein [Chloroflexota bacterium]
MEHQIKVPMHGKRVPIIPHYGLAGLPSRDPAADVNPNVHDPETLNTLTQILARHKALRIDGPKTERNLALVLLMLGSGYGATDLSIFAPAHLAARKIFQPSTFHAVSYARSRPRNSLIDVVADWLASSPPATKHTPYFAPLGARQIQRIIGATAAPYTGVHLKRIYRHIIEDPDAFLSSLQRAHLKILADDPRPRHLQQFPYTKHVRNYSSEKPINKALDSNLLTLHSVLND